MRRLLVLWTAALLVTAGCGGSHLARGTTTYGPRAPSIRVVLTAQSHHPRVGKLWRYEVRVTDTSGRPVPARVHLQILFGGSAVGQIGRHFVRNGVWRETLGAPGNPPFPTRARGIPLVFQAVVSARGETVKRNWPIVVR